MAEKIWRLQVGQGPLIATAIHDSHELRAEVAELVALSNADRFREEDPFTGEWTLIAPTSVVGLRSRFEVDLNRPREKAVYVKPEDAWGLHVWASELPQDVIDRSLAQYDAFYEAMRKLYTDFSQKYGKFIVYDLHTYNHRRLGPDGPVADPDANPQVNIGTGTLADRARWAPVIDRLIFELRSFDFPGGKLDVRENVKFQGGNFARWAHSTFPDSVCDIAIEFKKFFKDEWTGIPNRVMVQSIGEALRSTIPGVLEELARL
jgi:hypothetical protein